MQGPASLFYGRRLCSEATVTSITKYGSEKSNKSVQEGDTLQMFCL